MMKTLADTLAEYRNTFIAMHQDKARWSYFVSTAQILSNEVYALTDDDPVIIDSLNRIIGAATDMQAGRSLTTRMMRSEAENDQMFDVLMTRLGILRDHLRTARPASEAKLMGRHIDTTQVPDPF